MIGKKKVTSDGDDSSLESNPAYNEEAEVQRYIERREIDDPIELYATADPFDEPQVTVGSVVSTTSSQNNYSKLTFEAAESEDLQDSCSVYYSQPFSAHHSSTVPINNINPPPLPQSRDGDGIETVPNVSYRKISSEEGPKYVNSQC